MKIIAVFTVVLLVVMLATLLFANIGLIFSNKKKKK